MNTYPDQAVMRSFLNASDTTTTQVIVGCDEYLHEGLVCDGVVVSFACTEFGIDVEILAAQGERIASLEPLDHPWETDDLLMLCARTIAEEVAEWHSVRP